MWNPQEVITLVLNEVITPDIQCQKPVEVITPVFTCAPNWWRYLPRFLPAPKLVWVLPLVFHAVKIGSVEKFPIGST